AGRRTDRVRAPHRRRRRGILRSRRARRERHGRAVDGLRLRRRPHPARPRPARFRGGAGRPRGDAGTVARLHHKSPTTTAASVARAGARADEGLPSVPRFSDPIARQLLSPSWSLLYRFARRGLGKASPAERARATRKLDVLPLRVLAIDAEIERAGCRQLVILGAGLDTRAYRLPLADVDVFEVDHPATQAYKRRRTAGLTRTARSLTFVAVDFERDSLDRALAGAGHRAEVPTCWIWEGVVMYLTDGALRAGLDAIAARSAPGSTLLVHYHEPERGMERMLNRVMLKLWSEPQIGQRPPAAMHEAVTRAGLALVSDTQPADWARSFGAPPPSGET